MLSQLTLKEKGNLSDEDEVRTSQTAAVLRASPALDFVYLATVGGSPRLSTTL